VRKSRSSLENRFVASLPEEDATYLMSHMEVLELKRGTVLYGTDAVITHAYLPHDCIVSLVTITEDGHAIEMAAIGREAMVGAVSAPATREAIGEFIVQLPGCASRIPMADLDRIMVERPAVRQALWNVHEGLISQTLLSVACNAVHDVHSRCCRWILSSHDRVGRDVIPLTHEFLAEMLGVQRSTLSAVLKPLQTAGMIEQKRGAIAVRDRDRLERATCSCYFRIRAKYDRLLVARGRVEG
jgi:CRP-like cAMP-binding protein